MTFRPPLFLALVLALAFAAPAIAANGITVVSPKAGAKVKTGTRPTFKVRVAGGGPVYVHVCKSKKKDSEGVICSTELIRKMKKSGKTASLKAPFFDYPAYWLNSPGTYYWQAYRISCEGNLSDCKQEGAVTKFKVG
jgi:hypothetical protein